MSNYVITIDNQKIKIDTDDFSKVVVDGTQYSCKISQLSDYTYKLDLDNNIFHITTSQIKNGTNAFLVDGHYFEAYSKTTLEEKVSQLLVKNKESNPSEKVASPMPGLILKVYKNLGENINIGESLFLLEAMKMENVIYSPKSGIIKEIKVKVGNSVEKNQILVIIE